MRKPSNNLKKILATNIRNFRINKKLSQEKFAEICDLHRTYIGSVERGERNVTLSTLEIFADILDVSVPELLTEQEKVMNTSDPQFFIHTISQSNISIYDSIEIGDPKLWIPTVALEFLLNKSLTGVSLAGLPLRTRSKIVKQQVCKAIGYPVPSSFKKTQPQFPGQMFDTYVQKSNNLQIWNEELSFLRRYVLIQVSEEDIIKRVKVVNGETLAILDTTGTLTQKFQARCIVGEEPTELISEIDTEVLKPFVKSNFRVDSKTTPIDLPEPNKLYSIRSIFGKLEKLIGKTFVDAGHDQERNRGASLHKLVCKQLGYQMYRDTGKFPDMLHQLLEIKLQTSPTIDLGLVEPHSTTLLELPRLQKNQIRHCDIRYAVFYAKTDGEKVTLTHLFLTTGKDFFNRFPQFQGKKLNKKIQIPLPSNFFET